MTFNSPIAGNCLKKVERLSGKTAVSSLMSKGKWGHLGHFKYCSLENGLEFCRIMVSVPKKLFKRAVKRNLLKRRIRESYRLQKSVLEGVEADILFIYNTKEVLSSMQIFNLVGDHLRTLAERSRETKA